MLSFKAKHPVKVHVWAGISKHGKTGICIFEGIMDASLYIEILEATLLPFLESVYLELCDNLDNNYKFYRDKDNSFLLSW